MKYDNKLHRSAKGLINYNNTRTQILDYIDIQNNFKYMYNFSNYQTIIIQEHRY